MPYIKADDRPELDKLMDPIIEHVKSLPVEAQDGALNYLVTRMVVSIYPRRYFHFNRAMGVLSAIQHELYRVVVGPYEDEKIAENGAVKPHVGEKIAEAAPVKPDERPKRRRMHDIN